MGCVLKTKSIRAASSISPHELPSSDEEEIEEVAELAIRANDDEYDLLTVVELTVRCNELPNLERFG